MAKKVVRRGKVAKTASMKVLPVNAHASGCSGCHSPWLCSISLITAVFFIISLLPSVGVRIINVHWGVWLIIALVFGWKPLMQHLKK